MLIAAGPVSSETTKSKATRRPARPAEDRSGYAQSRAASASFANGFDTEWSTAHGQIVFYRHRPRLSFELIRKAGCSKFLEKPAQARVLWNCAPEYPAFRAPVFPVIAAQSH